MKSTLQFRLVGFIILVLILGALVFVYVSIPRNVLPTAPPPAYSIQLKDKRWDTTVTGRFTVMDIDSFEPLPILILDLVVANTSTKDLSLDCVLVQSNDNGKTIQDIYYPFWALNIKPQDDLRLVKIPAQNTRSGEIAFDLKPTEKALWLNCGSDVKLQVQ